jgi:hypothetical protein
VTGGQARWTDDWRAPPTRGPSDIVKIVVGVVGGVVGLLAVFYGVAVAAAVIAMHNIGTVGNREHLEPVPIAAAACPYVRVMHVAATNFQDAYPGLGTNASTLDAARWPTTRGQLASTAATFEHAIEVSRRHFPAPVRAQLATTLHEIHAGRIQLVHARDPNDVIARTVTMYANGQRAFGYASDLVGPQCGVGLGA